LLMAETVTVNLPAHEVYRLLVDYFKRERMKVKYSVEPSLIEVAMGSLLGRPHDVKMEIAPENGKTLIEINFDFTKMYMLCLIALVITFVIFGIPFGLKGLEHLIVMETIVLAIGVPRATNATKKSFIGKVAEYLRNAENRAPEKAEQTK